jgi:hypothetical protein
VLMIHLRLSTAVVILVLTRIIRNLNHMRTLRLNPFALTAATVVAGAVGAALFVSTMVSAAPPEVTTQAATGISSSNATLNAMNGDTAASGSAFWVATSTFSVASSTSPSLPAGVYSTGELGARATSTAFSAQLSDLDIPSVPTITAGTTYYYVAWVNIGGTWYPGSVLNLTTSPSAPTTSPAISNITVTNIGSTTATINWTTDLAGTGQVMYGTTTAYGSTSALNTTASTTHSATLTGLQSGTTYHFAVSSGNSVGTTTSSDQSFITLSTSSSTPLAVTSIDSIDTSAVADGTFENGWKWVIHFTVPDNENAFRMQFTNWTMVGTSSPSFATANNVRISSPQSSNASTTGSGMMLSAANTYSDWIYLTGDSSTSTPGRQVDVTVEVRIPLGTTPGSYSANFIANTTPSTATSTTP